MIHNTFTLVLDVVTRGKTVCCLLVVEAWPEVMLFPWSLQVRQAGGVDIVSEALERAAGAATAADNSEDLVQLAMALVQLLSALADDNSANKLCVREAGALTAVAALLDSVLQQQRSVRAGHHGILHVVLVCRSVFQGGSVYLKRFIPLLLIVTALLGQLCQ